MNDELKLKDITNITTNGIFEYLPQYGDINKSQLNIEYSLLHSGEKYITPLVEHFLVDGKLTTAGERALGNIITSKFKPNWDRIYESLIAEYELLDNVTENSYFTEKTVEGARTDITNIGSKTNTSTSGGSETSTINDGKTLTHGAQTNTTGAQSDTTTNKKAGFNSSDLVVADSTEMNTGERIDTSSEYQDTEETTTSTNSTSNKTDETIEGAQINDFEKGEMIITHETETKRHGNIGVTSSQQMITQEIELRLRFNFYEIMYRDIDKIMCLSIY